ncbi:MAG: Mur ligase family protein [Acidobacteriota bacterium]
MKLPPRAAAALERLEFFGIHLGLERMRRLLRRLGHPEKRYPVVLVAGTNGKGSTAALLAAMAQAAGYRVGLYTSPHLESVTERIRIDGAPISPQAFGDRLLAVLESDDEDPPPTYFEAVTAVAFAEVAARDVDLAVFEVGLGGRLDATNAAEPLISLVTPIAFDHREHLGSTLTAIAGEKAGIFRRGRPAITWNHDPEVLAALDRAAKHRGSDLIVAPQRMKITALEAAEDFWRGQRVRLQSEAAEYDCELPLLGAHQAENLALAVRAAEQLRELGWSGLDRHAIERGCRQTIWPGRLEVLPLGQGRLLLDAAHNADGARRLEEFLTQAPTGRLHLLLGLLADKEVAEIVPRLAPLADRLVLTRPPHGRGLDPAKLLPHAPQAQVVDDFQAAFDRAREGEPQTLVVCGSFFLVGAIRRLVTNPPSAEAHS